MKTEGDQGRSRDVYDESSVVRTVSQADTKAQVGRMPKAKTEVNSVWGA